MNHDTNRKRVRIFPSEDTKVSWAPESFFLEESSCLTGIWDWALWCRQTKVLAVLADRTRQMKPFLTFSERTTQRLYIYRDSSGLGSSFRIKRHQMAWCSPEQCRLDIESFPLQIVPSPSLKIWKSISRKKSTIEWLEERSGIKNVGFKCRRGLENEAGSLYTEQ